MAQGIVELWERIFVRGFLGKEFFGKEFLGNLENILGIG